MRQILQTCLYDLRSDTVTKPTAGMMRALSKAQTGDDVFGEDPMINLLQTRIVQMTGKAAALFCPTGTMSNQIAVRASLASPPYSLVNVYEAGGISFHSGASVIACTPLNNARFLSADQISKEMILDDDIHHAPTKLIILENTMDGQILPISDIKQISELALKHNIPLHLDGARLWNASVATGISIAEYCNYFDSVSLCFSKGLGAPVGSILVGSTAFIAKARHLRKLFGGGWRQAGILAEAVLYALDNRLPLLYKDHEHAKYVADAIQKLGLPSIKPVETNMVWFDLAHTATGLLCMDDLQPILEKHGCRIFGGKDSICRLVFHHEINLAGCNALIEGIREALDTAAKSKL